MHHALKRFLLAVVGIVVFRPRNWLIGRNVAAVDATAGGFVPRSCGLMKRKLGTTSITPFVHSKARNPATF